MELRMKTPAKFPMSSIPSKTMMKKKLFTLMRSRESTMTRTLMKLNSIQKTT
jgi:hypothetical protein